jgi:hypothetical protein
MTLVRNASGRPLPCCWDDCTKSGHEEQKVVVQDGNKNLHYVFCGQAHKMLYVNSKKDYGNLPGGSKGLIL